MRVRRLVATGALVIVGAVSTAACAAVGDKTTSPRTAATIPADPAAALAAAEAKLGTENVRFQRDAGISGLNLSGQVNAKTKNWEITGTGFVVRRIGTDVYAQASGSTLDLMMLPADTAGHLASGGWIHSGLPVGREQTVVFNDAFPWNLAKPASQLTGITRTGSREFTGTAVFNPSPLGSVRDQKAKARVTADLDEQGRFSKITINASANSVSVTTVFAFTEYGARADITAPAAGKVVEEGNPAYISLLVPA